MNSTNKYVTMDNFTQVLDLLKENREIIREQVDKLSEQLTSGIGEITGRQDIANGRMVKAEEQIQEIRDEVDEILMEGCHQKEKHIEAITTLAEVGALEESALIPNWKRAKKIGIGGGLVGIGVLMPHIWDAIHWIFDHFTLAK
jgi:hypothetical protein